MPAFSQAQTVTTLTQQADKSHFVGLLLNP